MKMILFIWLLMTSMLLESFGFRGNHGMRNDQISPLLWLFLIILVITTGIVLYRYASKTSPGLKEDESNDAISIIKNRFANGEINKDSFTEILNILRQDSDIDYTEKLKIRLAKGEINISEFNEMNDLLLED